MFQRKSKAEQATAVKQAHRAREAATRAGERAASSVQHQASALAHTVKEKAGPRAEELAATASSRAAQARDRAVASIDHGIDTAVPKVDAAVSQMAPKIDHARDVIVDDVLPKIHDMLTSLQSGKDELLSRQNGTVAAVTGAPKKRRKKGGVLIAFAMLAAVGAGVAWYLNQKQSESKVDPWATPSRPIGGAPGVDSQVREAVGTGSAAASGDAVAAEAHETTDTGAGSSDLGDSAADEARMLSTDEIDELASETPVDESDVPGTNTEDTTGLSAAAEEGTEAVDASGDEHGPNLDDLRGEGRP